MAFFETLHQDKTTRARTGIIHTDHGDIQTPVFMPVGTQATVKSLDSRDISELGAEIILSNTYHLHLRPGEDLITSQGGLHEFMQWDKPILTDSGGFQVFSLAQKKGKLGEQKIDSNISLSEDSTKESNNKNTQAKLVAIDEDGVTFTSHIDGSEHRFTPESAIEVQHKLGADIIMAFDECTSDGIDTTYAREAMERTHRWAERSLTAHQKLSKKSKKPYRQFLFGIIQGSNHKHLREESAKAISDLDFDGIAIGGESVGYNMEVTKDILDWIVPIIGDDRPRYTMGLGFSPLDLFEAVEHGADMFDCVSPTRIARNGSLFVHPETYQNIFHTPAPRTMRIAITNAQFANDKNPIDPLCTCTTCATYSRSYLHHLFRAEELLAYRLATIHNLHFFLSLMQEIREAIAEDRFLELKNTWFGK